MSEELNSKELELLNKLKRANKKENYFNIQLKINDEILEERRFSAEKFSPESIVVTRTHFLMNDLIRIILDHFNEVHEEVEKQKKEEEIKRIWDEQEKKQNKNNGQ